MKEYACIQSTINGTKDVAFTEIHKINGWLSPMLSASPFNMWVGASAPTHMYKKMKRIWERPRNDNSAAAID